MKATEKTEKSILNNIDTIEKSSLYLKEALKDKNIDNFFRKLAGWETFFETPD